MAQHDYVIDNQTAPNFRADLNQALQAIVSNNSGGTAPSTTYGNMFWYDSSNNVIKIRSEADDGWISLISLDQTGGTSIPFGITATVTELNSLDGVTSIGTDLVRTPNQTSARATIAAAPTPNTSPGAIGELINIEVTGVNYAVPAGGTWAYSYTGFTASGTAYTNATGVVAGGTTVFPGAGSTNRAYGWAWRVL
jgi:hypothetical protein